MMESYLMMLYVTLDQESALKSFFLEQGWTFCKPDLSMITDKLGPATFHPATKTPLSETNVKQTIVGNTRKRKVKMPLKAPVMKLAKVLSSTRVTSVSKSADTPHQSGTKKPSAGSPQQSGTKQHSAGSPQQSGTKQLSAGSPQQSGLKQLRTGLIKEPGTQKLSTSVTQQSQKVSKGKRNKGTQEKLCEQSETSAFGEPSMREVKVEVDKLNKENADDGDDDDSSPNDRDDADDYLSDSSNVEPNSGLSVGDLNRRLKPNREKKPYDRENLKRAFEATLSGMSVYSASRLYGVPESTLRDRTRQKVDIDCQYGGIRIFSECEEKQLVDHIVYMAKIGYGYTITDIQYIAGDFARSLGKTVRAKDALSQGWMYSFLGRWEELKVVKPQKLTISRAKSATKETITNYFTELGSLLKENDLLNAPQRIYNIDETGFSTEHTPLKIVCGSDTKAQAVTSARSKTVTVIGGANALGNHVPPFYIFPGKRWCEGLLEGAAPGSDGGMSESGFVNRSLFETYLTGHFAKHVDLIKGANKPPTLVMYDGHKSHVSLTLTNWAKDHSVILFVLPPHSSHLTQPLDIGVFGPMKKYYNRECKSYMHANPGVHITRYDVARLTAVPYARAFSPENIMSAFRKAGIYPFDSEMINETQTAPSSIYPTQPENEQEARIDTPIINENQQLPPSQSRKTSSFFESRKITVAVQKPKRKFVPPFKVQGNLMSNANLDTLKEQHDKQSLSKKINKSCKNETKKEKKSKSNLGSMYSPKPSTSGKTGAPINLDESSSDDEVDDDPCCVCGKSFPPQLRGIQSLVIVKWGHCDGCKHWVHLMYCTDVRVLRRGSSFYCKHCPEE